MLLQLVHKPVTLPALGVYEGNFTVDYSVGTNTTIRVVTPPNTNPDVTVTAYSPSGISYTRSNATYTSDPELGTTELVIPDTAEVHYYIVIYTFMNTVVRNIDGYLTLYSSTLCV